LKKIIYIYLMKFIKHFEHFEEKKENTYDDNIITNLSGDVDRYGVDEIITNIGKISFRLKDGEFKNSFFDIFKNSMTGRFYIKKDGKILQPKNEKDTAELLFKKIKMLNRGQNSEIRDSSKKIRRYSIFYED
jgi:hypothetical protein